MPTTTIEVPAASIAVRPSTRTNTGTSRNPPPLASSPVSSADAERGADARSRCCCAGPRRAVRRRPGRAGRGARRCRAAADPTGRASRSPPTKSRRQRADRIVPGNAAEHGEPGDAPVEVPGAEKATAPANAAGTIAGRGDATAKSPGTPSTASTGVANAEPPAPNMPNTSPTPRPASTYSTKSTCSAYTPWGTVVYPRG